MTTGLHAPENQLGGGGEKDREMERGGGQGGERQTGRQKEGEGERGRETGRERGRKREGERERERGGERERGRERNKKNTGIQALMEQMCFNDFSVSICRLWYKKFLLTMIEIRKPSIQQLLPREQGIIMVTRSGDNPYLK